MTPTALTIAGTDPSGGAGIQADIKSFSALGVYAMSVVTAVVAQNTQGVRSFVTLEPDFVAAQMDAVFDDVRVDAIKIGMVSQSATIRAIAERLRARGRRAIVDPVMVATSGDRLLSEDAIATLKDELMPLAELATPNLREAALLTGLPQAATEDEMRVQGAALLRMGAGAVLMKGGHGGTSESVDLLVLPDAVYRYAAPRLSTTNDHGTGCTLAAAVAAERAKGLDLPGAVGAAKAYLHAALAAGASLGIGQGRGPVHHFHRWWPENPGGDRA